MRPPRPYGKYMRIHFGLFKLFELLLVFGLIAVCVSLFETACKKGTGRKVADPEERGSSAEPPGGK
jgi:hypothetical protein